MIGKINEIKKNNKNTTYNVTIKLLDKDSKSYLSDSKLVLKNEQGEFYNIFKLKKGAINERKII